MGRENGKLINEWCKKCGVVELVGYYNDTTKHKMYIYTNKCGILIGKAGCRVNEFKEELKKEFSVEYEVEFVEIRGGLANVNCKQTEIDNRMEEIV